MFRSRCPWRTTRSASVRPRSSATGTSTGRRGSTSTRAARSSPRAGPTPRRRRWTWASRRRAENGGGLETRLGLVALELAAQLLRQLAPLLDREFLLRRARGAAHRRSALDDDVARVGVAVLVRLEAAARVVLNVERLRVALRL